MPAGLMQLQSTACSAVASTGRLQGAGRALPRRHALSGAAVVRPAPSGLGAGLSSRSQAQGRRTGAVRVQAAATSGVPGANGASEGPLDWLTDEWKEADRKNLRTVSLRGLAGLLGCGFAPPCIHPAGPARDPLGAGCAQPPGRPTILPYRRRHYHSRRTGGRPPFDFKCPNLTATSFLRFSAGV